MGQKEIRLSFGLRKKQIDIGKPAHSSDGAFLITYVSGTTVVANTRNIVPVNSSPFDAADGKWHHYAITMATVDSKTKFKFFIDGTLDHTFESSNTIGPVDRPMVGTIGSLAATTDSHAGSIGDGKLSGSLDEIRFWKEARSEKEIGRFWYSPVHGGTDNDHTNANLGLYYKFNEGITGTESHDKVVLDYSGRVGNGEVIGWSSSFRVATSGIEQSEYLPESGFIEIGDPIINPANQLVVDKLALYRQKGQGHDNLNLSSLVNSKCFLNFYKSWVHRLTIYF